MFKENKCMLLSLEDLMDFIMAFSHRHISDEEASHISLKQIMDFIEDWTDVIPFVRKEDKL